MLDHRTAIAVTGNIIRHSLLCVAAGLCLGLTALPFAAQAATPANALVMAWNIDAISTFDPAQIGEVVTNEIMQNICDSLVDFDPADERKVIPLFAESWDVSDDRRKITFHLRKGIKFPSGNVATARDVALGMQRVVKLNFGNAAAMTEYGFSKDNVDERITAPDDATLVLAFDKPYPTNVVMLAIAAYRVSAVMDMKTIMAQEQNGDMGNRYLSTHTECIGPYRLLQWHAGESIQLQANEDYWAGAPALKRILIRHVAEPGTQRLLLSKGDVDVARDLSSDDLKDLDGSADVSIVKVLKPQLYFWTFNTADGPFANEKVRLAMRYLIDYDGLARSVMPYLGVPRASFVQLGAVGALDEKAGQPFSYDPAKAAALLKEAGYPNGFETNVIIGTLPHSAPLAQSVQETAARAGVKLKLERMANAQQFSRVRGREFQSAMMAFQTTVPDAHGFASRLVYNPDNRAEAKLTQYPSWRTAFQSKEMNAEVDAALLEPDPARRDAMYADLQLQVMQQGPMAIMFQMYNTAGVRKSLKGWTWNGFRTYYASASK